MENIASIQQRQTTPTKFIHYNQLKRHTCEPLNDENYLKEIDHGPNTKKIQLNIENNDSKEGIIEIGCKLENLTINTSSNIFTEEPNNTIHKRNKSSKRKRISSKSKQEKDFNEQVEFSFGFLECGNGIIDPQSLLKFMTDEKIKSSNKDIDQETTEKMVQFWIQKFVDSSSNENVINEEKQEVAINFEEFKKGMKVKGFEDFLRKRK